MKSGAPGAHPVPVAALQEIAKEERQLDDVAGRCGLLLAPPSLKSACHATGRAHIELARLPERPRKPII